MTHRIVNTVRSLAMYGAVSLGLRKARIDIREPDALRSGAEPEDAGDNWLFDRPLAAVSSEAYMLDQEYGRASGALASLLLLADLLARLLLAPRASTSLSRTTPLRWVAWAPRFCCSSTLVCVRVLLLPRPNPWQLLGPMVGLVPLIGPA